jgi:ATP-binding cassette subfamily F protein uup
LDEPTNDLDMETLDVLEDMLAEYDGTVILVSHDRAFLDGVVTATLAPRGDGTWLETPGGWTDLVRQGIPILGNQQPSKPKPSATPSAEPIAKAAKKLSYKDERRLSELEALIPKLESNIAQLEQTLNDPTLYSRDPTRFEKTSTQAVLARTQLQASEDEWLALLELKETLLGNA